MTGRDWLVGSGMAAALAVGYPLALALLPAAEPLLAELPGDRPFLIIEHEGATRPPIVVRPASLRAEVQTLELPRHPAAGIGWTTYRVEQGHRWLQEVTIPTMTGPFLPPEQEVCGVSLTLGAGLFQHDQLGDAFSRIAHRIVTPRFPLTVQTPTPIGAFAFTVPAARSVDVGLSPQQGFFSLDVRAELVDGTFLRTRTRLLLVVEEGRLAVRRAGRAKTDFGGPSFDRLRAEATQFARSLGDKDTVLADALCAGTLGLLCPREQAAKVAGRLVDEMVPVMVDRMVDEGLDQAIAHVDRSLAGMVRREFAPLEDHPGVRFAARVEAAPEVDKRGVRFPLCLRVRMPDDSRAVASGMVPGVVHVPGARAEPVAIDAGASIGLELPPSALNVVLFVLWKTSWLREEGRSPELLARLPREVGALAFEVTGFDPLLPPTVGAEPGMGDGVPLMLASVHVGDWSGRRVLAHARARLTLAQEGSDVVGNADLDHVGIDCARTADGSTVIEPCLSDLMPLLRDTIAHHPVRQQLSGAGLIGRLPRLAVSGIALRYEGIWTKAEKGRLYVRVGARVEAVAP